MNRRSLGIAGILGALALTCTIHANAARGVRTDTGNNWDACSSIPCLTLPDGLSFNPFGDDLGLNPSYVTGTDNAQVETFPDLQEDWMSNAPGRDFGWTDPAELPPDELAGNFTYAQVLFFDLGSASTHVDQESFPDLYAQHETETVMGFDEGGNLVALGPNQEGTWELAFNYAFSKFPSSYDYTNLSASLIWDGFLYTAGYDVLNTNEYNTFVYFGGELYEPKNWTKTAIVTDVPEPGTLALFLVGLAGVILVGRRRRSVASLSGA